MGIITSLLQIQIPDLPGLTILGFLGILFFIGGVILILSGLGIMELQQVTVINRGKKTLIAGLIILGMGIVFLMPDLYQIIQPPQTPRPISEKCIPEGVVFYSDERPDTTIHSLKLLDLVACSFGKTLRVNDRLDIYFTLQNVSDKVIQLQETFIAARNPRNENVDFGYSHQNVTIQPQQTILTKANKIVNMPGIWQFWPCYTLAENSSEEIYCPSEWRSFPVNVE